MRFGKSEWVKRLVSTVLCGVMAVQLTGCGTILYPERRGQNSGEIDVAVALMDAIGLVFGIIPGLIAFAVDFHTGAIYLPPGQTRHRHHRRSDLNRSDYPMVVILTDPDRLNADTLSEILSRETGHPIRLDDPGVVLKKANGPVDIAMKLRELSQAVVRKGGDASHPEHP